MRLLLILGRFFVLLLPRISFFLKVPATIRCFLLLRFDNVLLHVGELAHAWNHFGRHLEQRWVGIFIGHLLAFNSSCYVLGSDRCQLLLPGNVVSDDFLKVE